MSGEHSILAPSSAAIREACSGSRAMQELYPEDGDSQASKDGTAAHWAAAELFAGRTIDVGLVAPNGVMLDDEMVDSAEMYFNDVTKELANHVGFSPVIEERVDISVIHPLCWGTPDAWVFSPYKLVIWDFKYGHRYVEVFENRQMMEYVAGILEKVGITGISDQRTTVEFRIVQPRCYVGGSPIRSWKTTASDLRGWFNVLRNSEERAMAPDAPTTTNPHCIDCSARHACTTAQRAAYSAAELSGSSVPFDLPTHALGPELRLVKRAIAQLRARETGLEEQALAIVRRGELVPLFRAEHSQGRVMWNKSDAEVIALGEMMGVPISKTKPITPKQAVDAGLDPSLVAAFSEAKTGELKLKEDDGTAARKVFG
jgi:hypothetical protein